MAKGGGAFTLHPRTESPSLGTSRVMSTRSVPKKKIFLRCLIFGFPYMSFNDVLRLLKGTRHLLGLSHDMDLAFDDIHGQF
jgi:hypothetical protein